MMDTLIKAAAVAVVGCILSLTLKKNNAEAALMTSIAAALVLFAAAFGYIEVIRGFWNELTSISSEIGRIAEPLLKVVGVSVVTKVTSELCRDSGEGALAAKMELCGSAACIVVSLPIVSSALKLLGELV